MGEEFRLSRSDPANPSMSVPALSFEGFVLAHGPFRQDMVEVG